MAKIYCFIFLSCIGLLFTNEPNESNQVNQSIRLRLKWYHQLQFMGYYQAIEQGFYKDAGFDVELIEGNSKEPSSKVVLQGKAEFGVDSNRVLYNYLNGEDFFLVSTIFQYNPLVLVTNNKKIQKLDDFKDKTLMLYDKDAGAISILNMLSINDISIDSINYVAYDYEKLQKGDLDDIDGFELYLSEVPRFQKHYSNDLKIFNPISYGSSEYGDLLFTTRAFVKKYPAQVEKFKEASIKGWKYALTHRDKTVELIRSKYSTRFSKHELFKEHEIIRSLIQDRLIPIGYSNFKRWNRFADSFYELGIINRPKRDLKNLFSIEEEENVAIYDYILVFFILGLLIVLLKQLYHYLRVLASARMTLQKELKISRDHLLSLHKFASIGTWNYIKSSDTIFFSDGFFKLLGREKPLIKLSFQESLRYVHPVDQERFIHAFKELCDCGTPYELLIKIIREDQLIRYFSVSGYIEQFEGDKISKVQGEVQDITEFVEQRHKLGLTRYSIDNSNELMVWLDKDGLIVDLNEAACETLAKNREQLIGELLSTVYPNLSHKLLVDQLQLINETGFLKKEVNLWVNKELLTFELLASSLKFQENDYIYLSIRNMEVRKKHKLQLVQAKKQAEAAEHLKRNLISTMSDEFHQPMSTIIELSSKLLKSSIKEQNIYVNEIEKNSTYLLNLLSETLVYSSILTNSEKYSNFEIQEILNIACLEMHEFIKDSKIDLQYKNIGRVPINVSLDLELFSLLVKHLLENAIQYSTEGTIEVNLSFCNQKSSSYLILSVKDQGCGIAENQQEYIFQPFYQVTEWTDSMGTGMGLAICSKIIEAFNGKISVKSKLGEGSEFICFIPVLKFSF